MIPVEAVEAAAKYLYEDPSGLTSWERLRAASPDVAERYRVSMTRVLEAAAPYMAAEAWEKGLSAARYPDGSPIEDERHLPMNPYRNNADRNTA